MPGPGGRNAIISKNNWVENAGDANAVGITGPWPGQFWKGKSMQQKILQTYRGDWTESNDGQQSAIQHPGPWAIAPGIITD